MAERHSSQPRRRRKSHKRLIIGVIALLLAAVFVIMLLQTYDTVRVAQTNDLADAAGNGYIPFAGNILKYNRDGISLMNANGEDKWNQAAQMQTPASAVSGDYAAVADVGGTDVFIFDKNGIIGHAETSRPIEKVSMSTGGVAAVIQENGSSPVVSCFSSQGSLILEHQASLSESGYPISAALSDDGDVLMVSYLKPSGDGVGGRVVCYDVKTEKKDKELFSNKIKGEIAGEVFYLDNVPVIVAESTCTIFEGVTKPEKKKTIRFSGEIEKVFHDDRYMGFVTRSSSGGHRLQIYARNGSKKLDKTVAGNYDHIVFADNQVIMYSGQNGCMFTLRGIRRFEGQFQDRVYFVMPVRGINRYAVVTNDGISTVYLTK